MVKFEKATKVATKLYGCQGHEFSRRMVTGSEVLIKGGGRNRTSFIKKRGGAFFLWSGSPTQSAAITPILCGIDSAHSNYVFEHPRPSQTDQ